MGGREMSIGTCGSRSLRFGRDDRNSSAESTITLYPAKGTTGFPGGGIGAVMAGLGPTYGAGISSVRDQCADFITHAARLVQGASTGHPRGVPWGLVEANPLAATYTQAKITVSMYFSSFLGKRFQGVYLDACRRGIYVVLREQSCQFFVQ